MRLSEAILEHLPAELFQGPAPHILAVSGGRDSMLLLHFYGCLRDRGILKNAPLVFHLHHGLRDQADAEADLARGRAKFLGLDFHFSRRNASTFARRAKLGLEEAGRVLRYRALGRLQRAHPNSPVVTAHHADDYLESLLMHLIRGGGPGALNTLDLFGRVEGVRVFRPFVRLNRERIDGLVERFAVPFLDDDSNRDESFLRNRLRLRVTPLLRAEGLNPAKLWDSFHVAPDHYDAAVAPSALNALTELTLDRRLFVGALPGEIKAALDPALRALGLPPASAAMAGEIFRQARQAAKADRFRLRYESSRLLLWCALRGPVRLLARRSPYFRAFRREPADFASAPAAANRRRERIIYGGRARDYELAWDEEVIERVPGLRVRLNAPGGRPGSGGVKKLKKLFQELRLPPPVRDRLPLIRKRGDSFVSRVCLSFWEDEKDRIFATTKTGEHVR